MRWRFVDKVLSLTPWQHARALKAVSLEEYSLLLPHGREGEFPESLCLESCVAIVRWLVAASSNFEKTCVLDEVREFLLTEKVTMGDVLETQATVIERNERGLVVECGVQCRGVAVARGRVAVTFISATEAYDLELLSGTWKEIYAPA